MNDHLPGAMRVEGREFMYIEISKGQNFSRLMDDAFETCQTLPMPQDGGALEEKVRVILPDQTTLLALSFRGDLSGWRNILIGYCTETGRVWAKLKGQVFALSDGTEVPVDDCEVEFEP